MKGAVPDGVALPRAGLAHDLLDAEQARPDDVLLRPVEGEDLTVRDVARLARACASNLCERGIAPGDRVAIMSRNDPQMVAWIFGIHMLGAVEVEVNAEIRGPLLRHVITESDPALLICQPTQRDAIAALGDVEVPIIDLSADFPTQEEPGFEPALAGPGDLVSIMFTSGTTGPSKGVMHPSGFFSNCGAIFGKLCDVRRGDVWYHPMPLFHVDAHFFLAMCVQYGAAFAFPQWFSASRFWQHLSDTKTTHFSAVASMLDAVARQGPPPPEVLERIRRGIAAPIPASAYEYFEDGLGIELIEGYGQTEGAPLFSTPGKRRRGSMGWPSIGHDVAVLDANGVEMTPGRAGELVYRPNYPDMVTLGYWRHPEATVDATKDLWWHTGDAAHFDDDGFVYFDGRLTDSLRCRGENVSAWELESTVRQAPAVVDAAAVGMRDEIGGEDIIKIFVVLEPGASFDPGALFSYCEKNLARFAVPRYIEPIEESALVRSAGTGVIQKHRLPTENGPLVADRQSTATT